MNNIVHQIGNDVSQRAQSAASENELGQVIFDAVIASSLNPRSVSVEDAKQLLVIALRSFRRRSGLPSFQSDGTLRLPFVV